MWLTYDTLLDDIHQFQVIVVSDDIQSKPMFFAVTIRDVNVFKGFSNVTKSTFD